MQEGKMPLYEDRRNAENIINVDKICYDGVIVDNESVYEEIIKAIKEKSKES